MPKKIVIKKPQPKQKGKKKTRFSSNVEINIIDSSKPRARRNPKLDKQVREMQPLNIPVRPVVPQNILSAEQYDLLREKLENKDKEKKTDSKISALSTQNQLSSQVQQQTQQQLQQQIQSQQQLQQQLQQQMQSQMQSQQQLQQQLAQQIQSQQQSQQQLQQQLTQQQQHQQLVSTQNQNQVAQQHQAQLAQQFQRQEAFQQQLTNQQQTQLQQQAQLQQQLMQVQTKMSNANIVNVTQTLPSDFKKIDEDDKKIKSQLSRTTDPKEKELLKIELEANDYHRDILLEDAKKQEEKAKKIEKDPTDPSIYGKVIEELNQKISYLDGPDRAIMKPYLEEYKSRKRYGADPETFGSFIELYGRVSQDLKSGKFNGSKYLELFNDLKKSLPKYGKGEKNPITTKFRITKWMSYANALYDKFDGVGEAKSPFRKKTIEEPEEPVPAPAPASRKKGKKKKSEEYETFPEDEDVDSGLEVLRRRRPGRRFHEVPSAPILPYPSIITGPSSHPITADHLPPPPPPPPPPPTPSRPLFSPTPVSYATPKTSPILSTPWTVTGVMPSTGRLIPRAPKPKPAPKLSPTIIDIKPPTPVSDIEVGSRRSIRSNSSIVPSDDDSLVPSDPISSSSSSEEEEVPTVTRLQISRYKSKINSQIRKGENPKPRKDTLEKYGLTKDPITGFYVDKKTGRGLKAGMAMPRLSEDRPKDINRMLELYGDWEITKLRAVRKPLNKIIERLANLVTLGRFEKKKKEIGVQVYYHLFLVIALRSPEGENNVIVLEKNQRVGWKDHQSGGLSSNEEGMDVPLGSKSLTLEEFVENGEAHNKSHQGETGCKMYLYSARGDGKQECNCQRYVEDMLKGNGLWSEKLKDFVIQDVQHTTPKLLGKLLDRVTNLAHRANYMVKGGDNFNMYRYKGIKQ